MRGLNSDLMWGDPSLLAAFIMYTTKRLGVEVFKGWRKGGKKPRPPWGRGWLVKISEDVQLSQLALTCFAG